MCVGKKRGKKEGRQPNVFEKKGDNRMCVGEKGDNQLLINDIMLHYGWTLWTLLHHKIALNRSFPTVLFILNLVERLESYNQIFGRTLHGPSMDPHGPSVGNGFFSLSFDSMDMKLIRSER